jgi:hypothetical protein
MLTAVVGDHALSRSIEPPPPRPILANIDRLVNSLNGSPHAPLTRDGLTNAGWNLLGVELLAELSSSLQESYLANAEPPLLVESVAFNVTLKLILATVDKECSLPR